MSDGEAALVECRLTTFHCHATKAIELWHFTSYSFECLPPLDDGALFEEPTLRFFAATRGQVVLFDNCNDMSCAHRPRFAATAGA